MQFMNRRARQNALMRGVVLFVFACLGSSFAHALELGGLQIRAVDSVTKRPIADAEITLLSRRNTSVERNLDEAGQSVIEGLPTGLYTLTITHPEYLSARLPSVRVVAEKISPIQIDLRARSSNIEEVVVLGSAQSSDPLSSVGANVIDRESLRSAVGSGSDVLRSLDGVPGLFTTGEYSSFTVRGNGPKDNLILVDGIPFEKVVHFSDSFGEQEDVEGGGRFSVFAPNLIGSAEFQPGGWDAAYGGKSGSLLKLNVAEGNPLTPSYTARLDLAGLEVGYDGPSVLHDNTSVLFSARQLDFGRVFDTIGEETVGDPVLTDIVLKTTSALNSDHTLNVLAIIAPEEYTRGIDNVLASDEDEPGVYENIDLAHSERDNSLVAISLSSLVGETSEWVNRFYIRNFDESTRVGEAYPDLVPQGSPPEEIPVRQSILNSEREDQELGFRSEFSMVNRYGRLKAGAIVTQHDYRLALALDDNWIRFTYDQNDFRPDPDQRYIELTPEAVNSSYDDSGINTAVYVDQSIELSRWDMRAGVRIDRDSFSDETLVSPRFGANWGVSEELRFSATAGTYYQSPDIEDRARDPDNNTLENERVQQLSIGARYQINSTTELLFEPYYQKLENLVVYEDSVQQSISNRGEGSSYGFDTALIRRFDHGWSANINYSFNRARLRDNELSPYYDADFNRPHYVGIGASWEINEHWKIAARWKWASGTPKDEFVIYEDVLAGTADPRVRFSKEITRNNTERFGSFNTMNLRVDYQQSFGDVSIIAFVDIFNVLGSTNPSNASFNPQTGRDSEGDGSAVPLFGFRFLW